MSTGTRNFLDWTPYKLARLETLWRQGELVAEIARQLFPDRVPKTVRNAIIGKASHLGLGKHSNVGTNQKTATILAERPPRSTNHPPVPERFAPIYTGRIHVDRHGVALPYVKSLYD